MICPACGGQFTAPRGDLLHEQAGDHGEGEIICFHCPDCSRQLECDTHHNGQPTVGTPVVCPGCEGIIVVPSIGNRA